MRERVLVKFDRYVPAGLIFYRTHALRGCAVPWRSALPCRSRSLASAPGP